MYVSFNRERKPVSNSQALELFESSSGLLRIFNQPNNFGCLAEYESKKARREAENIVLEKPGPNGGYIKPNIKHDSRLVELMKLSQDYTSKIFKRLPHFGQKMYQTPHALIVDNLPAGVAWQDLKDIAQFTAECTFADINKLRNTISGFACFATKADMQQAQRRLNGVKLLSCELHVWALNAAGSGVEDVSEKVSVGTRKRPGSPIPDYFEFPDFYTRDARLEAAELLARRKRKMMIPTANTPSKTGPNMEKTSAESGNSRDLRHTISDIQSKVKGTTVENDVYGTIKWYCAHGQCGMICREDDGDLVIFRRIGAKHPADWTDDGCFSAGMRLVFETVPWVNHRRLLQEARDFTKA